MVCFQFGRPDALIYFGQNRLLHIGLKVCCNRTACQILVGNKKRNNTVKMEHPVSEYEQIRNKNIAANELFLSNLGLEEYSKKTNQET
jgi:hypothetical protein